MSNELDLTVIAQAIAETINENHPMALDIEYKLRDMYEKLITHLDSDVLIALAEEIKQALQLEDLMDEPKLYEIGLYGNLHELNKNHSCSRLQVIAFITTTNVIVVDPGSFLGIRTTKRSSCEELINSKPGQRRGLQFGRNESFELNMVESVTFSPKICIICASRPRMVLSKCGHYLMCNICYDKVRREFVVCPFCKKEMDRGVICNEFMSCVTMK